jgi:hypothetical protein
VCVSSLCVRTIFVCWRGRCVLHSPFCVPTHLATNYILIHTPFGFYTRVLTDQCVAFKRAWDNFRTWNNSFPPCYVVNSTTELGTTIPACWGSRSLWYTSLEQHPQVPCACLHVLCSVCSLTHLWFGLQYNQDWSWWRTDVPNPEVKLDPDDGGRVIIFKNIYMNKTV